MRGYLTHRLTCCDFEDGCCFRTQIRFLMVVTSPDQFSLLLWSQHHLTGLCHDRVLLKKSFFQDTISLLICESSLSAVGAINRPLRNSRLICEKPIYMVSLSE